MGLIMNTLTKPTMLALAALLVCSACAETNTSPKPQASTIRWEEVASATQAAKVSNSGLIMMR